MKSVNLCLLLGGLASAFVTRGQPTSGVPADARAQPPVLRGLGNRLIITDAADSWTNLCMKMKPAFTWNGRDMIWVETNAQGVLCFRLDCAYRYEAAPGKLQWVLLETREGNWDEWYGQVMGDNLEGVARLRSDKPTSDHGSGHYAIVLAEGDNYGTVYEVGWPKLMANGTSLSQGERRLYFLRDPDGKWTFLGEGPEECRGKVGGRRGYSTTSAPRVIWARTNDVPCGVHFVIERRDYEWASDDDLPAKLRRDLILYEEMVLDGTQRLRRVTSRPFLRVTQGDKLGGVVDHLSSWTLGWETGSEKEQRRIATMWHDALLQLNPGIDPGNLIPAKVAVLTSAEIVELLPKTVEPDGASRVHNR